MHIRSLKNMGYKTLYCEVILAQITTNTYGISEYCRHFYCQREKSDQNKVALAPSLLV